MGTNFSQNKCNYNCSVCIQSGNTPNIAGRFYIINGTQCRCNACHTIFDKSIMYNQTNRNVRNDVVIYPELNVNEDSSAVIYNVMGVPVSYVVTAVPIS